MFGPRLRQLAAATILVVLFLAAGSAAAAPAHSDPEPPKDWRASIAKLAHAPFTLGAQAYVTEAVQLLQPIAPAGEPEESLLRADEIQAVSDDAATAYVDQARFDTVAQGDRAYDDGFRLASRLATLATNGSADHQDEYRQALGDLLLAGRQEAEAGVTDVAVALREPFEGKGYTAPSLAPDHPVATADLVHARKALAQAADAFEKGLPQNATRHQQHAWEYARHALQVLGVAYDGDNDGDGIANVVELRAGASPLVLDTDLDGLTDAFELTSAVPFHIPVRTDTDANGMSDGLEDVDQDGLDALGEQQAHTNPLDPDTDGDGVLDGQEVADGTNPNAEDTDGDTLGDGSEPQLGTSPLAADTDGDGIRDDQETVSAALEGPSGLSVTLTGTGDLPRAFNAASYADETEFATAPGQAGPAFDLTLDSDLAAFGSADITIPYDPAAGDPSQLGLMYFDEDARTWVPAGENVTVDPAANVVHATISHFSTYAVFNIVNWNAHWTAQPATCQPRTVTPGGQVATALDLALVLDSSGSMQSNDPDGLRKQAAKNFVDALLEQDRSAVVDFDESAQLLQGLTGDKAAVKAAIDRIDSIGGTNIGAGVSIGNQVLAGNGDGDRARMMILLTDGEGAYNNALTTAAHDAGIVIYTIGLGSSVDEGLLRSIASGTGGAYHGVATAADLPRVFREIGETTAGDDDGTDTDGDGLTDCQETKGMLNGFGVRWTSDPQLVDTDGDGLTDAEEFGDAGIRTLSSAGSTTTYRQAVSNPRKVDSDGDGLSDLQELDEGTNPLVLDTDGDHVQDGAEIDYGMNPLTGDTDFDGFSDVYELGRSGLTAGGEDQGFNPLFPDKTFSKFHYVTEFAKGFLCGDFCMGSTIPWLAGNLAAGGSSVIPIVGWVIGGLADLRDAVADAIHGDFVGAGFAVVGVLPYFGDAAWAVQRVTRFMGHNPQLAERAFGFLSRFSKSKKLEILKEGVGPIRFVRLRQAGFSEDALLRLTKGRTKLADVADAVRRSGASVKPGWFAEGWREGERLVRQQLADEFGAVRRASYRSSFPASGNWRQKMRYPDALVGGEPPISHEIKTGHIRFSLRIARQIRKDAALVDDNKFESAVWHFVASGKSESIGVDPLVLDMLDSYGIRYVFHTVG